MKNLVKILSLGLLVFLAIAMVQEWDYFSGVWFGSATTAGPELTPEEESAAVNTVREALALMSHFYGSRGDERYADRMPVSERVRAEMQTDVAYLARNGRVQEPRLVKLEPLSVVPIDDRRLEIHTREFWVHRTLRADGQGEADPPRSVVMNFSYRMVRERRGWQIAEWNLGSTSSE